MHVTGRGSHLRAASVDPSTYLDLVQATEEMKSGRLNQKRPETNESSYGSDSSSGLTEVSTLPDYP